MSKKAVAYGEYIIARDDSGTIKVLRTYDNVIESLRNISAEVGFEYDENWNTRTFGSKLVKAYGNNNIAHIGEYGVKILESGSIKSFRLYSNTIGALREIAEQIGFAYDDKWTTRQFGNKLIDELSKD